MVIKRIYLEGDNQEVYLDVYRADGEKNRKALLIIPGGGYAGVCADREGEPIALAFMPYGFQGFVLHYSVGRTKVFPAQLIEASLAMKHIKDHAEEYGIDPEQVFVTGFSAGGHLTASLGTLWHIPEIYDAIEMDYGYNKPAGIMPIYPVITGDPACGHMGSIQNLFGTDDLTEEQMALGSLEKHVDEKTSPAFLAHTAEDGAVPVENSLRFATALARAGQKFELHIYPDGPHGMALGNELTAKNNPAYIDAEFAKWVEQAAIWTERIVKE